MTPEVEAAIEELRVQYPSQTIDVTPDAQGGAYVLVDDLPLGDQYTPARSWVGFVIGFQYPYADVYPHFLDAQVRRTNGQAMGVGFSGPTTWHNRQALQVSRRSNRWNPATDSAAMKLAKVLDWVRKQ
jgi:hypothetical protein